MPSTARGVGQRSRRRGLGIAGECVGSSAGRPDGVGSPPPPPPPPGRVSSSRFSPLRAPSGDREWVVRIVLGLGTSAVVVPGRSSTLSASASISSTNKSNTFCTAASSASHPSASSSFCSFAPLSVPVRAVAWSVLVVVPPSRGAWRGRTNVFARGALPHQRLPRTSIDNHTLPDAEPDRLAQRRGGGCRRRSRVGRKVRGFPVPGVPLRRKGETALPPGRVQFRDR